MNKIFLHGLILIILSLSLESVEERDPIPFYYLPSKTSKVKLNLKRNKICRVKLKEVVHFKNIETLDCYEIDKKLSHTIKLIIEKNEKKNEINLMFVDETNKIVNPEIQTTNGNYTIKSIIYLKKDKSNHIELIDKNDGYNYFTYDPLHLTVVE
ncbi:MAG: hypothetical protein KBF93_17065 [Leptospiraceae bacterium]|nr:hypothetical protein [Leptospiraceae bacterium]